MSPGRILITGATGFVGRHLIGALQAAYPAADLLTPQLDITDAGAVADTVRRLAPDAIIHLAAVAAPSAARRDPHHAWQVNLHGTLNVGRAVMAHAPAATLLFAGSADAYGASFRGGAPLDETAPLAPQNVYGATKAAADLALGAMAAEGLRAIRARPFNHTGPGQTQAFVIPAFARQVARIAAGQQAPLMQVGALDPERDFLDVRDICRAYAACLGADLAPGTILNLCSGQPRRIGDILQSLLDLAGVRAEIQTEAALLRPADIPRAVGSAAAARHLLGWAPAIPWETTLQDVLADWTKQITGVAGTSA
jgi:GDP-4-dehydro-6-deoxy-D-mannose reductase